MRKISFILVIAVLLLLLSGCKKSATTQSAAPPDATESLIEQARQAAKDVLSQDNATTAGQTQTMILPPSPQQAFQGNDVVSRSYVAPCSIQKYKGLNLYCKGKNVWHNYSTITSWYVPYTIVLFLLFVFIIWAAIKLWKSR